MQWLDQLVYAFSAATALQGHFMQSTMPRDGKFDSSFALLRDPYGFIAKRSQALNSDVFEARIMLRPTLCMTGAEAAALFYDAQRFVRQQAAPEPLRATLFGKGGVQALDGDMHRHRKAMFLKIININTVQALAERTRQQWIEVASRWTSGVSVVLYSVAQELLTRSVCAWAGLPLIEEEVAARTRDLVALFDDAGRCALCHLRSRLARQRAEQWLMNAIETARRHPGIALADSALAIVATHRDADGRLLTLHTAAVELLNVLRPTVAVSVYIVFAAHALHRSPEYRMVLAAGDPADRHCFLQEVRRYYPFFPAVAARVRESFEWQGMRFEKGRRTLLDLYGTNHDRRRWQSPHLFEPTRFRGRALSPFELVPQGGGDAATQHRCPGESIALSLMNVAVDFLVNRLEYTVPPQDLGVDMRRLPALPRDRFVIKVRGFHG